MCFIGLGLAMDAFAVSIISGISLKKYKIRYAFKIALFFGVFQAIMPLIGWAAGLSFRNYIEPYSHWVAFFILLFIACKMIFEATVSKVEKRKYESLNLLVLSGLAIATSIDALAVGISFSILSLNIVEPIIIIGLITFTLSFIGVYLGERFGIIFGNRIDIIGGVILILIGFKILLKL
jgi:manganese efflux pump family protein